MHRGLNLVTRLATIVVVVALSACASAPASSTSSSANQPDYQIGVILALSGAAAPYGTGTLKGLQAYVDMVNRTGGVNGHKVITSVLDDGSDPTRSVTDFQQLSTQKNVIGISGLTLSTTCGAVYPQALPAKIPLICQGAPQNLLVPAQPYLYQTQTTLPSQVKPLMDYGKSIMTGQNIKVASVITNSSANVTFRQNIIDRAKTEGWQLVVDQTLPLGFSDFSAQATEIAAKKPDLIVAAVPGPSSAVVMMRALQSNGVNVPVLDYTGANDVQTMQTINNPSLYTAREYGYALSSGNSKGINNWIRDAKADGFDPNLLNAVNGYVQGMITVAALKKCVSPCTGEALEKALESLSVDTAGVTPGVISYSTTSHIALHSVSIVHLTDPTGFPTVVKSNVPTG